MKLRIRGERRKLAASAFRIDEFEDTPLHGADVDGGGFVERSGVIQFGQGVHARRGRAGGEEDQKGQHAQRKAGPGR